MALPTFTKIAAPQDQQFLLPNGAVSPAWHRFLLSLPDVIAKAGRATTELDAGTTALEARVSAVEARVSGLGQPAVADVTTSTLTIGAAYSEAEIEALEARVRDYGAAINTLIARLEAAGVLEA